MLFYAVSAKPHPYDEVSVIRFSAFTLMPYSLTHVQTTDLLLQANAARFWTYLTGLLVSEEDLSVDIPDADPFFGKYGPSFELTLTPGRRPNLNSSEILNDLLEEAFSK